jgi:hypothetical protein
LLQNAKASVTLKNVGMTKQRCIVGGGHDLFRKEISQKKIPLSFVVAKNSGSAFLNSLESPVNFSDPDFLATASQPYRCPLEKNGHGRKEGLCEL